LELLVVTSIGIFSLPPSTKIGGNHSMKKLVGAHKQGMFLFVSVDCMVGKYS
jgi:hypothetical protein